MAVLLFKRSFNAERENETYETHSFNMIPFGEIDSTMNSFPLFTISMMSPTDMSSIGCIFIAQCTESFVVVLCMGETFSIYHQNPPFISAGGGVVFIFFFLLE